MNMVKSENDLGLIDRGCSAIKSYPLGRSDHGEVSSLFTAPNIRSERTHLRQRFAKLKLPTQLADALTEHGARCEDEHRK